MSHPYGRVKLTAKSGDWPMKDRRGRRRRGSSGRMARKLRIEYPGAVYHVMNRGDRREPVLRDDADRQGFIETLGKARAKTNRHEGRLALRLRRETTMTVAWIAQRL